MYIYIYIFGWDMIIVSIDAGAQVAIFTPFIHVWTLCGRWDRFCSGVELPVQRRLYPIFVNSIDLPDVHEYFAG